MFSVSGAKYHRGDFTHLGSGDSKCQTHARDTAGALVTARRHLIFVPRTELFFFHSPFLSNIIFMRRPV